MEMSKEHTPTPWSQERYNTPSRVIKKGKKDIAYTADYSDTGYQDAKFIVKACNSHDRLVEALEKLTRTAPIGLGGWDALLEANQLLTELKQQ